MLVDNDSRCSGCTCCKHEIARTIAVGIAMAGTLVVVAVKQSAGAASVGVAKQAQGIAIQKT